MLITSPTHKYTHTVIYIHRHLYFDMYYLDAGSFCEIAGIYLFLYFKHSKRLYLWGALSLSNDVVEIVSDVCIQTSGQVPGLADPVIIFSSKKPTEYKNTSQSFEAGVEQQAHVYGVNHKVALCQY